jgi:hypothetical protein
MKYEVSSEKYGVPYQVFMGQKYHGFMPFILKRLYSDTGSLAAGEQ